MWRRLPSTAPPIRLRRKLPRSLAAPARMTRKSFSRRHSRMHTPSRSCHRPISDFHTAWTQFGHGADRVGSGIPALWASSDWIDPISAHHQRPIGRDPLLEVVGFHARDQANVFKCCKLLLGFGGLPERQIEFAYVSWALRWRRLSNRACW